MYRKELKTNLPVLDVDVDQKIDELMVIIAQLIISQLIINQFDCIYFSRIHLLILITCTYFNRMHLFHFTCKWITTENYLF